MSFAGIVGQRHAVEMLQSALRLESIHHAYLFAGPEGVGKELTAIAFAQALLCREQSGRGCGECSTCRRIARRNHPDVAWVMPQSELIARGLASRSEFSNVPSREIRVEQVRGLQERLALRPLEASRKLAIIASADQMNAQAQNAFLKTLEEPPRGSVLVLIAASPELLLPTIRSRCSKVRFGPLPLSFIEERLKSERQMDPESVHLAAVLSEGSLSRALEMKMEMLGQRKQVIALFEAAVGQRPDSILRFAETFGASRETAEEALGILRVWLRDLVVVRSAPNRVSYSDLEEIARQVAASQSEAALHRRWNLLEESAEAISERNCAPRLQLERMLIEMGRA
jgi:DNA polymerase-3 subunit delta'